MRGLPLRTGAWAVPCAPQEPGEPCPNCGSANGSGGGTIELLPGDGDGWTRFRCGAADGGYAQEVPMEESMLERVPLGTVPGADDATLEVPGHEDQEAQDRQRGSSKVPFWAALWGWVRAGGRRTGAESVSRPGEKSQGASREDRSNRRSDPADGDTAP